MQKKVGPYFLVGGLLIVLFFILGVRVGSRVEKTNKTIGYILSTTPLPKINLSPTATPIQIEYQNYFHKSCGISFIYPLFLTRELESSNSAKFSQKDQSSLEFNCTSPLLEKNEEGRLATASVLLKNNKILARSKKEGNDEVLYFKTFNPQNGKTIYIKISEDLYILFASTLQFVNK